MANILGNPGRHLPASEDDPYNALLNHFIFMVNILWLYLNKNEWALDVSSSLILKYQYSATKIKVQ